MCNINELPKTYQDDINKALEILKNEGCNAIYLFGSLVNGSYHENSNINIGVSGLLPQKFFRVWADLDNTLLNEVELVDFDFENKKYVFLNSIGEVFKLV